VCSKSLKKCLHIDIVTVLKYTKVPSAVRDRVRSDNFFTIYYSYYMRSYDCTSEHWQKSRENANADVQGIYLEVIPWIFNADKKSLSIYFSTQSLLKQIYYTMGWDFLTLVHKSWCHVPPIIILMLFPYCYQFKYCLLLFLTLKQYLRDENWQWCGSSSETMSEKTGNCGLMIAKLTLHHVCLS
jgi:hypothetical protein